MPLVVFECPDVPRLEVPSPDGGRLVDLCDDHSAAVPFSCRSASCGTCRVDVVEGEALLEPPGDEELDVLDLFGDDPAKVRLACQLRVRPGEGRLRLRVSEPG
jgi:ferredoxin